MALEEIEGEFVEDPAGETLGESEEDPEEETVEETVEDPWRQEARHSVGSRGNRDLGIERLEMRARSFRAKAVAATRMSLPRKRGMRWGNRWNIRRTSKNIL